MSVEYLSKPTSFILMVPIIRNPFFGIIAYRLKIMVILVIALCLKFEEGVLKRVIKLSLKDFFIFYIDRYSSFIFISDYNTRFQSEELSQLITMWYKFLHINI